jgi:hypothetical protein
MQYLYLIKCQHFYKIGVANDVQSRLAQLSTGNPFELEALAVYGFNSANAVEAAIHQRFYSLRARGEWFALDSERVDVFHNICQLLGGVLQQEVPTVDEDEVEEAEALAEPTEGGKWDYAAMFADGWRMERSTNGRHLGEGSRYWCWRKGNESVGKEYIYGGVLADLPHPIEEMRRIYKNGNNGQ